MTVATTQPISIQQYTGPGTYSFSYLVYEPSTIVVIHTDTSGVTSQLTYNSDYTVTLLADPDVGGDAIVTWTNDGDNTGTLSIARILPIEQQIDWANNNALDMGILEKAFDRDVMMIQQLEQDILGATVTTNWTGEWSASTAYVINEIVTAPNSNWYICIEPHTSDSDFDVDLTSGKWLLTLDVQEIENYRDEAEAARDAAAISAAAALVSENASATSESNAATSESNAFGSAANASVSETNAAASEATAIAQAAIADTRANDADNSADDANNSANAASNSAVSAGSSAISAATNAGLADTSASNAASSETAAGLSASSAGTSETNAAASALAAGTSASNASTSETNSAASALAASTSASNAATSESNAASSASSAAISAAEAASYAGFVIRQSFAAVDIDGAGKLHISHHSGIQYPMAISVWDENNQLIQVLDGVEATDIDNLFIDLSSFMPIVGTWNVTIRF